VFGELPAGCSFAGTWTLISGNGSHTLYAASVNSFGDREIPVTATLKIDETPPAIQCDNAQPYIFGTRGWMFATVTDAVSGPVSPQVSTPIDTSTLGKHKALVTAANNADTETFTRCPYTVLPAALAPTPRIASRFVSANGRTAIKRLVVSRVPFGATVNLSCRGNGCPFAAASDVTGAVCHGKPCRAKKPKRGRRPRTVSLTRLFAAASMARGADLTVSVTKVGAVGRVWLFTMRGRVQPSARINCLKPGSSVPGRGCQLPPSSHQLLTGAAPVTGASG
jgi:hypothetical protein